MEYMEKNICIYGKEILQPYLDFQSYLDYRPKLNY